MICLNMQAFIPALCRSNKKPLLIGTQPEVGTYGTKSKEFCQGPGRRRKHCPGMAGLVTTKKNDPVLWKDPQAKPRYASVGCPHSTLNQRSFPPRLQITLTYGGGP